MVKINSNMHPKLSEDIVQKLQRKNITTIIEFTVEDSERLATFTGLPYKDVLEIKQNILKKYGAVVRTACEMLDNELTNIVPTNISGLDNLLEGGLYPGQIYELCGTSSSGKSQLCFTIAANVALRSDSLVRYIDTKRDFSYARIEEILIAKKCTTEVIDQAVERIKVCCVQNIRQLFKVLQWLIIALATEEESLRTRIIIIDSLPAVIFKFAKEHETTYLLSKLANTCRLLSNKFTLSLISVNVITQWNAPESDNAAARSTNIQSTITPALGKYWSHVPNTRLSVEKTGLNSRKVTVWNSFQLKSNLSCSLALSNAGMT